MTFEEAKRILHPDTTWDNIRELTADGVDPAETIKQACIVACEAINKALASHWVPVSERLPEEECIAACFAKGRYGYGEMIIGYVAKEEDVVVAENNDEYLRHVTHWMPLPEPPKEELT